MVVFSPPFGIMQPSHSPYLLFTLLYDNLVNGTLVLSNAILYSSSAIKPFCMRPKMMEKYL